MSPGRQRITLVIFKFKIMIMSEILNNKSPMLDTEHDCQIWTKIADKGRKLRIGKMKVDKN